MVRSSAPPGRAPFTSITPRNHVAAQEIWNLTAEARQILDAIGVVKSQNWVSRLVRRHLDSSVSLPFAAVVVAAVETSPAQRRLLAERADLRYLLSYADPTGETAVRNVMKEQARAH
jgi:hypothetical protein